MKGEVWSPTQWHRGGPQLHPRHTRPGQTRLAQALVWLPPPQVGLWAVGSGCLMGLEWLWSLGLGGLWGPQGPQQA